MFTRCFGKIITSFVSDKGKTEEGKEKRQTETDKLRIKAKPCLNTREVCFRKCSVSNNARVVSIGNGIEPSGVSQQPIVAVLRLSPVGETRPRGRTQSGPF